MICHPSISSCLLTGFASCCACLLAIAVLKAETISLLFMLDIVNCKFPLCIHFYILLCKLEASICRHLIVLCETLQSVEDSRFPGRGRTLGAAQGQIASGLNSDSNLQARLLEDSSPNHPSDSAILNTTQRLPEGRYERWFCA